MSGTDNGLKFARRRRRVRATVVLGLAATLVVVGLLVAVRTLGISTAGTPPATTTTSCTPTALPQASVRLNVYNASGSTGSARKIAQKFAAGGFDVGSVSNDPYKEKVDGVAQIRYGAAGEAFAKKYVRPLVPGATLVRDGRTDSSVDLVLGKEFTADVPTATPSTSC